MDGQKFDAIAKALVADQTRRGFLTRLAGVGAALGLAGVAGRSTTPAAAQETDPKDIESCQERAAKVTERIAELEAEIAELEAELCAECPDICAACPVGQEPHPARGCCVSNGNLADSFEECCSGLIASDGTCVCRTSICSFDAQCCASAPLTGRCVNGTCETMG